MLPRIALPELADQQWWPAWARDAMTGYLHTVIAKTKPYAPAVPRLAALLRETESREVLDLCAGAGGPWPGLRTQLADAGAPVDVVCTDVAPHHVAAAR